MTHENDMKFKFQWLQLVLLRHRPIHSFAYCLAAFRLERQSQATAAVTVETVGSTEANLFLSDLIRESVVPMSGSLGHVATSRKNLKFCCNEFVKNLTIRKSRGLPWWFIGQVSAFPMQRAWARFLIRELDPTCHKEKTPHDSTRKIKDAMCCNEDPEQPSK